MIEQPQVFRVNEESVVALLGIPENTSRAVMFVTGGNQYRVGTHRMFVRIARALNDRGIATMRFDRPGTGDQLGAFVEFDQLQADLKCAAEAFRAHLPQHCELWVLGLCDGATAATMGVNEISAQGLVLINPWVEDAASESRVRLRQYYVSRLVSRDFWRKL
ncbi:MAG: alpha/beta hydrolase, partial [Pseudomonadota bacterium]